MSYALIELPQKYDLQIESARILFEQSLRESRASVINGAFLTRAHVVSGSLQLVGHLDLRIGIHQFLRTSVSRAVVTINVRQTIPISAETPSTASSHGRTIIKSVNVPELVFGFQENPQTHFVVPRDSTLESPTPTEYLYTFLTLRNQPGGTTLEHQIIPVHFVRDPATEPVVAVMRSHINKHSEVKDKMANAFRHIPKMQVRYMQFAQEIISTVTTSPVTQANAGNEEACTKVPHPKASTSAKRTRKPGKIKDTKDDPPVKKRREKLGRSEMDQQSLAKTKKLKKASIIPDGWKCELCGTSSTVMRRRGPSGLNCACNSCGQAWAQANRSSSKVDTPDLVPEKVED